jgi:opacity protein-like surface antigen
MLMKNCVFSLSTLVLGISWAYAGDMGSSSSRNYKPVGTLFGGVANLSSNNRAGSFADTDGDIFTYTGRSTAKTAGLVGVFLGVEPNWSYNDFFLQAGLEYSYFGKASANGLNTVGIEPATSTLYQYQYDLKTQQLLAVGKLFKTVQFAKINRIFYPYISAGLGVAFNHVNNYQTFTTETGDLNLTPVFHNQTTSSFSYNFGIGIDTPINEHVRVGLGYKFSDFLQANLSHGQIIFNQYAYPVSFSLQNSHTYVNQFVVQASYVV